MKFYLEGLNCANCISKIENELNSNSDINAKINFANQTIIVKTSKSNDEVYNLVRNVVKKYESNVVVKTVNQPIITVNRQLTYLIIAFIFYVIAYLLNSAILFTIVYLFIGYEVILRAIKNIYAKQFLDENFLMTIATISAIIIGEYPEAVAVMLFYQTGEYFQDLAVSKSRNSVNDLLNLQADYATILVDNKEEIVDPKLVPINSNIIIKPGEKIPLDCIITKGYSLLDTKSLTGEANLVEVNVGDQIYASAINQDKVLWAKTTATYENTTASKIMSLIEDATLNKSQTENFISKFAKIYTPIIVLLAIIIAIIPPLITNTPFNPWIYRSLIFLVISCPCALVISVPLSYFAGIGLASKYGIIIKGSNYLDAAVNVENVVFDKTGTITTGNFKITKINGVNYTSNQLLELVAYCESYSNHPIASAILEEYNKEIDKSRIDSYNQLSGYGISAKIDDKQVLIGSKQLLNNQGISFDEEVLGTTIYIAINNNYEGYINIVDDIKNDALNTINYLNNNKYKTYMLTGDKSDIANDIANKLNISKVYSQLLPDQKVEKLEEILSNNNLTMFIGDGVNDSPVIARSDVGVSMGISGSDAAIAASDIIIMNDRLNSIELLFKIAAKTRNVVTFNIAFALSIKFVVLLFGVFGIASMWSAVFADVGVTLLAVLNASRILKFRLK